MKALLTLTVVLTVGIAITATVHAQESRAVNNNQEVFRQLVTIQMVESLQHPLAMVRSQTLKNAIVYSTLHRDRVDLNSAISSIATVAAKDESSANRRLAIAALRSIDSYRATQYLARLEAMEDNEYRSLIAGVLAEYREGPSGAAM